MVLLNRETVHSIVGIMGNIISFGLFASPIPTVIEIWKSKSVKEYKADPYVAAALNCMLWVFYALPFVHPGRTLVITINSVGLLLELFYISIFIISAHSKLRMKIIGIVMMEIGIVAILATVTLKLYRTYEDRSRLVGILCVIFNIVMYVSPLTVMKKVITTKSVKYMPFCLAFTTFVNASIWIIFSLIKFDPFVLISNGIGLLCGATQLILYACYYKATPIVNQDIAEKRVDVQFSTFNA